jgi:hypothetical protein
MIPFHRYYVGYRRIGFSRFDAFRFAWTVATAGVKPILVRATVNRGPSVK